VCPADPLENRITCGLVGRTGPAALKARREDLLGGLVRRAVERVGPPGTRAFLAGMLEL
jgi:hypothetical protein